MSVPTKPIPLLYRIYRRVLPTVHTYYDQWKERAKDIPNDELRAQALDALDRKGFHCEGGGVFGLLADQDLFEEFIQFMIAYQLMCDYLDNLCDQSPALDPNDFRQLHQALLNGLNPEAKDCDYYAYHQESNDGGYLRELVETCQRLVQAFPSFDIAQPYMLMLSRLYGDLQVHKHVIKEERIPRLESWFSKHQHSVPTMTWYEFSACTGSTLGLYTLAAYSTREGLTDQIAKELKDGYFPWVQGVHLLLDYFIDQEEDIADDELNFLFYYEDDDEMIERFTYFVEQAEHNVLSLPDGAFHRMILKGVIAMYLADEKVQTNKQLKAQSKQMIKMGGWPALIFYLNNWMMRR
ncbi:tetraprenyl-beta-curcumene synthase family protein [Alkalihalobacillus sp. APA_J-10(15)]|nr:tetraprenyl-beta-curcumene synthase family protein [Halalkalibacter sp. APA_J-10(15)]